MSDPTDGDGRGQISAEERAAFKRRISELDDKLSKVRGAPEPEAGRAAAPAPADGGERGAAMGQALRISTELVVGVAAGGGIGWLLDRWLGTAPWLMILLFVAGFAAGLLNVIRAARRMQPKTLPGTDARGGDDDD